MPAQRFDSDGAGGSLGSNLDLSWWRPDRQRSNRARWTSARNQRCNVGGFDLEPRVVAVAESERAHGFWVIAIPVVVNRWCACVSVVPCTSRSVWQKRRLRHASYGMACRSRRGSFSGLETRPALLQLDLLLLALPSHSDC